MKSFTISFFTILLLFIFSCKSTTDTNINEKVEKVSINNSEVFEFKTGISGDEERVTITLQPNHYEISQLVRDSTTNWQSVYRYKPEEEFKGKDQAEIKIGTGSDGASPNRTFELIKFEFTIN